MNENKIAFIICTDDRLYYDECIRYLSDLILPENIQADIISADDNGPIAEQYNRAIEQSDAKYRVYLYQNVFIVNKNYINNIIDIFSGNKDVGMIGVTGCRKLPDLNGHKCAAQDLWDAGKVYTNDEFGTHECCYGDITGEFDDVEVIDGMIIATQYDVPWKNTERESCGISQSFEFIKEGYRVVVPYQTQPWILYDNSISDCRRSDNWQDVLINEYGEYLNKNRKYSDPQQICDNGIITIETRKPNIDDDNDIYQSRKIISESWRDNVTATISVVAYNRPDVTRMCVESILKYTSDIKYKLILVYNASEHGAGILEYFKSVDYDNKLIINITQNMGAPFAYQQIIKHIEGRYYVHVPNDVIVTHNWLSNMIRCAESDERIGMVNPVSSNVSNCQDYNFEFDNYDQMQKIAYDFNKSDPSKWHEKVRLITIATLFTRECVEAVGSLFDTCFTHDFGDDDLSFRVRRAGYRIILANDTWVHHDHKMGRDEKVLSKGREIFKKRYYGVDAWSDACNDEKEMISLVDPPVSGTVPCILGIDVKCGLPVLEVKNKLRASGINNAFTSFFSEDAKYYTDLSTICSGEVVCTDINRISRAFSPQSFEYIIAPKPVNLYPYPDQVLKDIISLLKPGGQAIIKIRNTFECMTMLNMLGHKDIFDVDMPVHIPVEVMINSINILGCNVEKISSIKITADEKTEQKLDKILSQNVSQDNIDMAVLNMSTYEYVISVVKD